MRELTERDYGIDLMVEVFLEGILDKSGRDAYEASGALFHIQIKGTETRIPRTKAGTVSFSIKKDALLYVEKFSVPFLLFRADVSSASGKIYFVWLQRYIRDVLDPCDPSWREGATETVVLRIPKHNVVGTRIERLQRIALHPKFLEELVEYREIFRDVDNKLFFMSAGKHEISDAVFQGLRTQLYRARRLNVLLTQNHCSVDHGSIDQLIRHVDKVQHRRKPLDGARDFPHRSNFKLLADSIDGMALIEKFVEENDGLTTY